MRIAIQIFGELRSFKINMKSNLESIKKIFDNNQVDVFILFNKFPSEEDIEYIKNSFNKFNCHNIFLHEIGIISKKEIELQTNYEQFSNYKGKYNFTANMWYRRYMLNNIRKDYENKNNIVYNSVLFTRLFDTVIIEINELDFIDKMDTNVLYIGLDTFFYGDPEIINKVFEFGNIFPLYDDYIWDDIKFFELCYDFFPNTYIIIDRHTMCSEVQLLYYLFINNIKLFMINIPVSLIENKLLINRDYYIIEEFRPFNKYLLIALCPLRK
jgi:hypothetical protein